MIQFSDREMQGERLVLDSKTELYYLGHGLTLRGCTLVLKVPARALVVSRTRLIDCTIEVQRELKNFSWEHAHLKGCRFTGALTSCDFGGWPDEPGEGSIEDCDFSAARLDGCRFIGCDARTLRFPRWPCFTLLDPVRRHQELSALSWPGELGMLMDFSEREPTTAAVTYSATALARRYKCGEADLKAVLERLDGVVYQA